MRGIRDTKWVRPSGSREAAITAIQACMRAALEQVKTCQQELFKLGTPVRIVHSGDNSKPITVALAHRDYHGRYPEGTCSLVSAFPGGDGILHDGRHVVFDVELRDSVKASWEPRRRKG